LWVGSIADCIPNPINCGTTVVIRPPKLVFLQAAAAGGPVAVSNFFNGPEAIDLYPGITQDQLTKLQSGNYTLVETPLGSDPAKHHFFAIPVPLGPANFEFVISTIVSNN
jgi:hypothetical protein